MLPGPVLHVFQEKSGVNIYEKSTSFENCLKRQIKRGSSTMNHGTSVNPGASAQHCTCGAGVASAHEAPMLSHEGPGPLGTTPVASPRSLCAWVQWWQKASRRAGMGEIRLTRGEKGVSVGGDRVQGGARLWCLTDRLVSVPQQPSTACTFAGCSLRLSSPNGLTQGHVAE